MIRWLADENFNNHIVHALCRYWPSTDIVRAQDVGLAGATDPELLNWAALQERVILTHDVTTLTAHAYVRIVSGRRMPGLVEVRRALPVMNVVEDLILISECSLPFEYEGQVIYLPLR